MYKSDFLRFYNQEKLQQTQGKEQGPKSIGSKQEPLLPNGCKVYNPSRSQDEECGQTTPHPQQRLSPNHDNIRHLNASLSQRECDEGFDDALSCCEGWYPGENEGSCGCAPSECDCEIDENYGGECPWL